MLAAKNSALPNQAQSDILTVAQVANATSYSEEHIRRFCRTGKISASKPGRKWFITRTALDNFILGRNDEPTEEERLDAILDRLVEQAPPLTVERKARLRELLSK